VPAEWPIEFVQGAIVLVPDRPRVIGLDDLSTGFRSNVENVLTAHELADALTTLSPEHRAVIDELYFGDSTISEAAARLRVPEGTIKSRAYYGLRALRAACEERGVFS